MPNPNKPKPPKPQPIEDSIMLTVALTPGGNPFLNWQVASDKPVHAYGLRREINGNSLALAAWETGYPSFYTQKQGAFIDEFLSCNPPLSWSSQPAPFAGDTVNYFLWYSLGDATNHVIVQATASIILP